MLSVVKHSHKQRSNVKSNELKNILPWENRRVNIAPDITVTNE